METITPNDYSGDWLRVRDGQTLSNKLFRPAGGEHVDLLVQGGSITVRNVGWDGRHPGDVNFFALSAPTGGTIDVENVYIGDGAAQGSRGGIYVQGQHEGTINFRRVNLQHVSNNGIYASSPGYKGNSGVTNVYNSYFKDCNISHVRLGTPGRTSVVRDTVIHGTNDTPPCRDNCSPVGAVRPRGVWAWEGPVRVVNCDIQTIDRNPLEETNGASITTQNTRIGQAANVSVPAGVPTSATQAASGGSGGGGVSIGDVVQDGANDLTVRPE